jgi:hypothetical protein
MVFMSTELHLRQFSNDIKTFKIKLRNKNNNSQITSRTTRRHSAYHRLQSTVKEHTVIQLSGKKHSEKFTASIFGVEESL